MNSQDFELNSGSIEKIIILETKLNFFQANCVEVRGKLQEIESLMVN